ncbi:MAG: hypothetical protein ACRCSO_12740 [Sphingomonas sp.]
MVDERPTHINAEDARAGRTRHIVRYVLAASMILIVVLYAIIFWAGAR